MAVVILLFHIVLVVIAIIALSSLLSALVINLLANPVYRIHQRRLERKKKEEEKA